MSLKGTGMPGMMGDLECEVHGGMLVEVMEKGERLRKRNNNRLSSEVWSCEENGSELFDRSSS
jgi:hypothetical protein